MALIFQILKRTKDINDQKLFLGRVFDQAWWVILSQNELNIPLLSHLAIINAFQSSPEIVLYNFYILLLDYQFHCEDMNITVQESIERNLLVTDILKWGA